MGKGVGMHPNAERSRRSNISRPYELAAALRAMRRQQGLTQAALAERAGISRQWVCDAENNKLPGGVTMLCRLIFELGHTIELVPAPDEGFDLDAHLQEVTAQ